MVPLRIGIVGTGFGGYGLTPAFRLDSRCDVVAIAASSGESAQKAAKRWHIPVSATWRELVEAKDIDAIAIAAPPTQQMEIAAAVLTSGKAVFAEKPLTASLEDAVQLTRQAENSGLAHMIDFIFPELDTWARAKSILDKGLLGTVRHAFVDWRMESYDLRNQIESWKTDSKLGGGVLTHFGCHTLYYLEWLLGPISDLSAHLSIAPGSKFTGDTLASLAFFCGTGVSGSVTLSSAALMGSGHRVEIYGDSASIFLENDGSDPVEGFRLYFGERGSECRELLLEERRADWPENTDSRVAPAAKLVARFVDWVTSGEKNMPSFREGLRVQFLLDAVVRSSANKGHAVSVQED